MNKIRNLKLCVSYKIIHVLLAICFFSCNKYLNEKATKQNFIPSSLEDFQALLDNPTIFSVDPPLLEILSDEYFVTSNFWLGLSSDLSSNYIWASNATPHNASWNSVYQQPIYVSNVVLDYLEEAELPIDSKFNNVKGSALFIRANAFFNLAQVFTMPYDNSRLNELGIVLKTTSIIDEVSSRATIKQTYEKIVNDLHQASELLPIESSSKVRPTKVAAWAALARVFLVMQKYDSALHFANLCLKNENTLLDFNELTPGVPIQFQNKEVIFHNTISSSSIVSQTNAKIDTVLLKLYSENDLRYEILFRPNTGQNKGTFAFRGSYNGPDNVGVAFTGFTYSEMILIQSECLARKGEKEASVVSLNSLLEKRYDRNSWVPIDPSSVADPLELVLTERRKELVFRGLRWLDLRRLNVEGANITIKRLINETEFSLPPNDKRLVALIPYDVINRSDVIQNPR